MKKGFGFYRMRQEKNLQSIHDNMDRIKADYIKKVYDAYDNVPESGLGRYVSDKGPFYGKPYVMASVEHDANRYFDERDIYGIIRSESGQIYAMLNESNKRLENLPPADIIKIYNSIVKLSK